MTRPPARVKIGGNLYHPDIPDGAVRVDRVTRWGNPHRIGWCKRCTTDHNRQQAIDAYRHDLDHGLLRVTPGQIRQALTGRDLACWCPPGEPCHADLLLAAANAEQDTP
jgi:hypothetical protein